MNYDKIQLPINPDGTLRWMEETPTRKSLISTEYLIAELRRRFLAAPQEFSQLSGVTFSGEDGCFQGETLEDSVRDWYEDNNHKEPIVCGDDIFIGGYLHLGDVNCTWKPGEGKVEIVK